MMTSQLRIWESRLQAHLGKQAKTRPDFRVTLIEVVDEAALWLDPFADLHPEFAQLDFEGLITRYPVLGCAAASEIGFRFEGVGTVFWAKFEDLLGTAIPVAHRHMLADVFADLASRYPIQTPAETGFSQHFSIIAWPISNALMPFEIAAPLGRLMARGPRPGVVSTARTQKLDLSAMRAWALSWEGMRLGDWLSVEAVATRVITALLTDNAQNVLSEASFRRISAGYAQQSEAFFALCDAKRRQSMAGMAAKGSTVAEELDFGRLGLERVGSGFALSVSWTALPLSLLEQGRQESSARSWRPRLWGASRTHYENALGSLPIQLRLEALPEETVSAFEATPEIFGEDSPIAKALLARVVDWSFPLVFLCDPDGRLADRADLPMGGTRGQVWIIDRGNALDNLPSIGEVAGVPVRLADLNEDLARTVLITEGWLRDATKPRSWTARHPLDSITSRKGRVRPEAPFCIVADGILRVERLGRRGSSAYGLIVEEPTLSGAATPCIFLFDRQTAFDALAEQRLLAKIESSVAGARWPIEVMLLADDEILAYARDEIVQDGTGLAATSPILRALGAEHVRLRLLEIGRAILRIRVGNHPWDSVPIQRVDGEVDWSAAEPAASLDRAGVLVTAEACTPYRFSPLSQQDVQGDVHVVAYQFADGRLAAPTRLTAPNRYNIAVLSADFSSVEGCRQLIARGAGVLEVARARRGWASAECRSLAAIAARVRVVHQFEAPLVIALCGREWHELEKRCEPALNSGQKLFRQVIAAKLIDLPDSLGAEDRDILGAMFADKIAEACPGWTEDGRLNDEAADLAISEAFEATLLHAHGEDRLLDLSPDDFDFGAPADAWQAAGAAAINAVSPLPVLGLIAPTKGAEALSRRDLAGGDLAEISAFLADWTSEWCLPRSVIDSEIACSALQFWLSPGTGNPEQTLRLMARDVFLARAVRFTAQQIANPALANA
jgi:hypothetical protein